MTQTARSEDERVIIFDTTLRDGQQCPGAGMTPEQNFAYARLASKLGVDVLEAGFPAASTTDYDIVKEIAAELGERKNGPEIAGLCQLREEQITRTINALQPAIANHRAKLHTYLPVDPNLMQSSLGSLAGQHEKLVSFVGKYCAMAVEAGLAVEFSPEGYSRQGENFDFVTDLIRAAVDAGATTINCPDTIGGASPLEGKDYFVNQMNRHAEIIKREFPDKEIVWSAHCHNDLGLAVPNSINAVFDGPARQIEGCINGIGERAGNAALEQCVMILEQFGIAQPEGRQFYTNVKKSQIQAISNFVAEHMLARQPHSPVTGDNSAKHTSGGHTNAVLKDPRAYQAFDPKVVGSKVSLAFGPLSGGNHAKSIIEAAGYLCEDQEKGEIAQFIKDLFSDRRKGITDEEVVTGYLEYRSPIRVTELNYQRKENESSFTLQGDFFGQNGITGEVVGEESPLTALKMSIDKSYPGLYIEDYQSTAAASGVKAPSITTIKLKNQAGDHFEGKAEDHDINLSAMQALIMAVNKAYIADKFVVKSSQ